MFDIEKLSKEEQMLFIYCYLNNEDLKSLEFKQVNEFLKNDKTIKKDFKNYLLNLLNDKIVACESFKNLLNRSKKEN